MSDTPNARRRFLQGGLALIPLVTLASHGVPTAFGDTPLSQPPRNCSRTTIDHGSSQTLNGRSCRRPVND